jgi:hypothetical protein
VSIAKWQTFSDKDYGYTIKYPDDLTVWGDPEYPDYITFGEYVTVEIYEKTNVCPDCFDEKISKTEDITINGYKGKKVTGILKTDEEVDGYYEVPQSFIRYEFENGNFRFHFNVNELPVETYNGYFVKRDYPTTRKIGEVPVRELKRFEMMLSTLQFAVPARTTLYMMMISANTNMIQTN